NLHEEIVAGDAGIVDQDVELAESLDRLGHELVDRRAVAEVARQRDVTATERSAKILEFLDVAAGNGELRPPPRQRLGNCAAEAAAGAGHQRGHSCKVEHYAISFASASISSIVTTLVTFA